MARYIDADKLPHIIGKVLNEFDDTVVPISEVAIKIGHAIKEAPTADAMEVKHGEWISGDKLPETDENVLVWFEYFRYGDYNCPFQTYGISHTYDGEWSGFVNGSSGWTDLKIIAWQPLPQPPKTE